MEEALPLEYQGDTYSIIEDLYTQLDIEEDDYDFDKCFDHYLNNGVLFLKVGYFGDTLEKDNIIEVPFIILNKYVPIEL